MGMGPPLTAGGSAWGPSPDSSEPLRMIIHWLPPVDMDPPLAVGGSVWGPPLLSSELLCVAGGGAEKWLPALNICSGAPPWAADGRTRSVTTPKRR